MNPVNFALALLIGSVAFFIFMLGIAILVNLFKKGKSDATIKNVFGNRDSAGKSE